tara:strand:+ start:1034 stop:1417 length:384 start_codon:yes stop_codon:yes gene_type:complete
MSEVKLTIGDTSVLDVSVYKDDALMDLTNYLVLFTVKRPFYGAIGANNPDDTKAVITKNSEASGGIEKYGNGKVRITLGSDDTKDMVDGSYDYDLQVSLPGEQDTVITVDSGTILFSKEITRRTVPL